MSEPAAPAPLPASPPPAATPHPPAAGLQPTPLRTLFGLLWPLGSIVALLLVLLALATGAVRAFLGSESGSRWLLQQLPMVQVQGFAGTLLDARWRAERVRVNWGGGQVVIEELTLEGLRWQWRPHAHAWLGLQVDKASARTVSVETGPPRGQPARAPASLRLPLALQVERATLARLQINRLAPWEQLQAEGVELSARAGAPHRVRAASARAYGVQFAGQASIADSAPFALEASATAAPLLATPGRGWTAQARLGGLLAEMQLQGQLRGEATTPAAANPPTTPAAGTPPGRRAGSTAAAAPPPALDLQTTLRPFQAWPLAALELSTQALDLSALRSDAPATRISGQARVRGGEGGTPLVVTAELDNAAPGRWNEGRVPVSRLTLEAEGTLARRDRIEARRFELLLADGARSAGRVSGNATWLAEQLRLELRLADFEPQRVDGRIAAMRLAGPLTVALRGLPSPDLAAPRPAQPVPPRLELELDLQGTIDHSPVPVRLTLAGSADDQRFELQRARAEAGSAVADFKATLARSGARAWQLASSGSLADFDPVPWWSGPPGEAGAAWRRGPHRLSGRWQLDLRLPADAERLPALALAQRVAGNGEIEITPSTLAGVPLTAQVRLAYSQAAAPTPAALRADISVGGNTLQVEGRADPLNLGSGGGADRWRAELKAERLAALAPIAALAPPLAAWVPRQGSASGIASAEGRWPAMRSEGAVRLSQLAAGPLTVALGSASWQLDVRAEPPVAAGPGGAGAVATVAPASPLALQAELAGATWARPGPPAGQVWKSDHLRLDLRGTAADHRIEISAALPLAPPRVAEQAPGIPAQSGTRVLLQADGAWRAEAAGGSRWRARIERLLVGSWDGSAGSAPPASGWAEARELRAELGFDAQRRLVTLQADPGRISLAQQVAMRWDEIRIDLRGERAQIQLDADIEPFTVAPLLARAQPGMGWGGDLKLGARIRIRAAEDFEADGVFERQGGDLQVTSAGVTSALGLTELRLAVNARDGQWSFTPQFRGRVLGELSGQVRASTSRRARWPAADAALSGDLLVRVADIGIWAPWVPPGWRLTGELASQARLSGSFGQPQFTGELRGSQLGARNLLQGVEFSDGSIAVQLQGDNATIERFTLKGGEGELRITGGALLGEKPEARLALTAERFRVLGRVDRLLTASGQAQLQLGTERARLEGAFRIDEAMFDANRRNAPSLDDDVTVRRPGEPEVAPVDPTAPRSRMALQTSLEIDAGDNVRFKGFGVDTRLTGKLRITTPGNRLAINGTVSSVDGTYAAYAQKLDIERGVVSFTGPVEDPRLDVLALRPNLDVRVGAAVTGPISALRIRLYSEPEMSDTDKLSWLVLGRAPEGLGRADTALLQRAAVALLAGESGNAPTDTLMKALGIDDVSLRQSDGDVRETVISIGKQLSRRWYVGYERGVNATTGTWQLTYRIAQRFTLRAQSGLENALDVIWSWRLQETPADAGMRKSTIAPRP